MMVKVWCLQDDRAGNNNQILGVAEAMGIDFETKKIFYSKYASLPNFIKSNLPIGIDFNSSDKIRCDFPEIVIAAGRKLGAVARYIKKSSNGKTKIVQIMSPGLAGFSDYDLVFVPKHDIRAPKGKNNIVYFDAAPHRITEKRLIEERDNWQDKFASLPEPRTALIIGGATKSKSFGEVEANLLCDMVLDYKKNNGGSLLITTSRRTGEVAENIIKDRLKDIPSFDYYWGTEGLNPYFGYISCADDIIVTGDSVSMCSEACASGKPVYIFAPSSMVSDKHARLHKVLYEGGFAKDLADINQKFDEIKKLNSASEIAVVINKRLLKK